MNRIRYDDRFDIKEESMRVSFKINAKLVGLSFVQITRCSRYFQQNYPSFLIWQNIILIKNMVWKIQKTIL